MSLVRTYTRTHTVTVPANPYLVCDFCGARVEGFADLPGPVENYPCGHAAGYSDLCPSWGPVDGCQCQAHLGYRPHGDPKPAQTDEGKEQGPA